MPKKNLSNKNEHDIFRFQRFYNYASTPRNKCSICRKYIDTGIHDLLMDLIYCHDHADEDGRRFSSICVDPSRGRTHGGRFRSSCHLFADDGDVGALHDFADLIGLRRSWYQGDGKYPHYDLTDYMREKAVKNGAREVDRRHIVQTQKGGDE